MRIFVASWFFPPATSSEGIVTYKLLRNSENQYDVCSSTSQLWGYSKRMEKKEEENIQVYSIQTDDIDEWVSWTVEEFELLNAKRQYNCIMTRSTPPESILVGERIKATHPDIKWIASLADPVANNPYELKAYIDDCPTLTRGQKEELKTALKGTDFDLLDRWGRRPEEGIRLLCKLKNWERIALEKADLIISPTNTQLRYIYGGDGWNPKFFALPHSYDESFYPAAEEIHPQKDKIVLSFLGYSDQNRSLKPLISAVRKLKEENDPSIDKLEIHIIGNNPREIDDDILNSYLFDTIKTYPGVDYYQSLKLMMESDWLIHVDAFFPSIKTGGSVFFAGKLADYMGAGKPILAITGRRSPAEEIVSAYGGKCFRRTDIAGLASFLASLADNPETKINQDYRRNFEAVHVAKTFDAELKKLMQTLIWTSRTKWPEVAPSKAEKLISVCVPAYNVEKYLDRCIYTLINHDMSPYLDIMIVDDGSVDKTAVIAREYEEHYPGIVRLISKENGGHGSTINRAVKEAKGKYFRTVDGDDWVDSRQLAAFMNELLRRDCEADVISSNYHEVDMDTSKLTPVSQEMDLDYYREYRFEDLDADKVYLTLAGMMIKTSILREMKVKILEHAFYVDVEFILFPVPYINTILFTDHYIYKYMRGNAEQSVAIPNMLKRYENHEKVMKRVLSYGRKVSMDLGQKDYYNAILKRLLRTHYGLGLIYDKDKVRGCSRSQRFDRFLMRTDPELYRFMGEDMMIVRIARKCSFKPSLIKTLSMAFPYGLTGSVKNLTLTYGKETARKLIYNPVTINVAQSRFMDTGMIKELKDKVNLIFNA